MAKAILFAPYSPFCQDASTPGKQYVFKALKDKHDGTAVNNGKSDYDVNVYDWGRISCCLQWGADCIVSINHAL